MDDFYIRWGRSEYADGDSKTGRKNTDQASCHSRNTDQAPGHNINTNQAPDSRNGSLTATDQTNTSK